LFTNVYMDAMTVDGTLSAREENAMDALQTILMTILFSLARQIK